MCFSFTLPENVLGYIDWIPQRLEIQFSASHGGSLPGTTGYIHEEAYALSISKTTTEEQTANGISEGTIFRKRFSAIYQRSYGRSSYLLHGFGVVRRLAFHVRDQWSLFLSEVHAKLTRILHRFWTTLQGSREDIGWLQRTRASLCSVDGTGRFKEILNEIRNGLHCLPDTLVYLFIPGETSFTM